VLQLLPYKVLMPGIVKRHSVLQLCENSGFIQSDFPRVSLNLLQQDFFQSKLGYGVP